MAKLDWNRFNKTELVEILEWMEDRVILVERLDPEIDTFGQIACSCDVINLQLPAHIGAIAARAAKRTPHLLRRLLRREAS